MYECLNLSGFVLVSRAGPVSRDNVVSATVAAGGGHGATFPTRPGSLDQLFRGRTRAPRTAFIRPRPPLPLFIYLPSRLNINLATVIY